MIYKRLFSAITIIALLLFITCGDDDGDGSGDTVDGVDYDAISEIVYSEYVQPIFDQKCSDSGCHSSADRASGLDLSTWDKVFDGSSGGEVVIPYNAERSLFGQIYRMEATPHSDEADSIKLELRNFLDRWIDEGAKNDAGTVFGSDATKKVYVTNQGDDMVSVIDRSTHKVIRLIEVGDNPALEEPHFVSFDPEGTYWFLTILSPGELWKFDAATDNFISKTGLAEPFSALSAISLDGQKAYVSHFNQEGTGGTFVSVVNTADMTPASNLIDAGGGAPHGIEMSPDGDRVYVACMLSDYLTVINTAIDDVEETVRIAYDVVPGFPKYQPLELTVDHDGNYVYISCQGTDEIRVVDIATLSVVDSISVAAGPWHLAVTPDNSELWVANRRADRVQVIDLSTNTVTHTIEDSGIDTPHGLAISPDGAYVYVSNENAKGTYTPRRNITGLEKPGTLVVINTTTYQVETVIEIETFPTGVGVLR